MDNFNGYNANRNFDAESRTPDVKAPLFRKQTGYVYNPNPGKQYLIGRGISQEVIEKHSISFDPQKNAVIIPVTPRFYISRNIEEKIFNNPPGMPVEIDAKPLDQMEPVFIVEGIIDAMSIETVGGRAIALNNTHNKNIEGFDPSTFA